MENLPVMITDHKLGVWLQERESVFSQHGEEYIELTNIAPKLTRVVKFELPAARGRVARCTKINENARKRERDHDKAKSAVENRLLQWHDDHDVESSNLPSAELFEAVKKSGMEKLATLHSEILKEVVKLGPAVGYYTKFAKVVNPEMRVGVEVVEFLAGWEGEREQHPRVVDYRRFLGVEVDVVQKAEEEEGSGGDDIDWGDFEDDGEGAREQEEWGGAVVELSLTGAVVEDSPSVLSSLLLCDEATTATLIDNLTELESFLSQLEANPPPPLSLPTAPNPLPSPTVPLSLLTSHDFLHFSLISSDANYLQRVSREVMHLQHQRDAHTTAGKVCQSQYDQALSGVGHWKKIYDKIPTTELAEAQRELTEHQTAAKSFQARGHEILRKWFKPRKAYIVGDIEKV